MHFYIGKVASRLMTTKRRIPLTIQLIIAAIALVIVMFFGVTLGAANTSIADVWHAIWSDNGGEKTDILRGIRFPRVVAAVFVGAALAVQVRSCKVSQETL